MLEFNVILLNGEDGAIVVLKAIIPVTQLQPVTHSAAKGVIE